MRARFLIRWRWWTKKRQAVAIELVARGHSQRKATKTAGVPRSTYGARTRPRPPCDRAIRRLLLTDVVGQVHNDSRGVYGYRRVTAASRIESGLIVNHKLVASIKSDLAIHGLPTPKSRRRKLIAIRTTSDLVNREFTATGPNQLSVTNITEHPTRKGRVFPCVLLDVFPAKPSSGLSIEKSTPVW